MAEELLEKIPAEKCWALTAKFLTTFFVLRGEKFIAPELGKEDGIIAPVLGVEKWMEIHEKLRAETGRLLLPMVKETFNIPVMDAREAAKLVIAAAILLVGPEFEYEFVEKTPGGAVVRWTKCPQWERYKECEVDPTFIPCHIAHRAICEEGLKVVNPKISSKLTKTMPWGDPYCEEVYEFKDK